MASFFESTDWAQRFRAMVKQRHYPGNETDELRVFEFRRGILRYVNHICRTSAYQFPLQIKCHSFCSI